MTFYWPYVSRLKHDVKTESFSVSLWTILYNDAGPEQSKGCGFMPDPRASHRSANREQCLEVG